MTRILSNRMSGPLTKEDLEVAKAALSTMVVGFTDDIGTFLDRAHVQWELAPLAPRQVAALRSVLDHPVNVNTKKHKKSTFSQESIATLDSTLRFDIALFEYAKNTRWPLQGDRARESR